MIRALPLVVLAGCSALDLSAWVWDDGENCWALEEEVFAADDYGDDVCADHPTLGVGDASCVVVPTTCLPAGYAPFGTTAGCADALTAWEDGVGCDGVITD